jgi:hypothetical protein
MTVKIKVALLCHRKRGGVTRFDILGLTIQEFDYHQKK